ncbi:MAG: S9 family peptidase [Chitinophagaceae bacterium]|nr:S9 family peptidase [Chitinophagaceae bacterium]
MTVLNGCTDKKENITPPVAEKKPHDVGSHGDKRIDYYYWMNAYFKKTADSDKVVQYLEAENKYRDAILADVKDLRDTLFKEMKGRIKEKDQSVPVFHNGYYYYNRYEEGSEYPVICRKKESLDAPEIILLDVNRMAKGFEFFEFENSAVSPDNKLIAYAVDTLSRRQYTIYIKNLETGEVFPDAMYPCNDDIEWANDSKHLFYIENNTQTLLTEKIKRHVAGTPGADDKTVYHEKDSTNYLALTKTTSDKFIMVRSRSTLSSEVRFLDANNPKADFKILQPRMKDVLYDAVEQNGKFLIRTNLDAKNFRLMEAPVESPSVENWKEVIPHRKDVLLEDVYPFKNHFVAEERKNGLMQLRIRNIATGEDHYLDFGEPAYAATPELNPEYNTPVFRYNYTSLTTPESEFDYDMNTKTKTLLKQQEVVGGYNKEEYVTERLWAPAGDGKQVPISIVYKKGFKRDGSAPLLLYGYGSYGHSSDPYFSSPRLSLIDRGFAYAIAHIRGGQELGREWYEDGRLLHKKNSFSDFIAVAEYLVKEKYTSPAHLYAYGGSAGGLLVGAVVNMKPDLWNGVVAEVPFVDVVTTMLDETIPLTTNEFDEWGDPKKKEYYDYLKSYSPYDNVERKSYPNLLVMTGLHDSQVQYFEPAKWVAKLREYKIGDNLLVLSTNMSFGHGGASGRFDFLHDIALMCAFFLKLEKPV